MSSDVISTRPAEAVANATDAGGTVAQPPSRSRWGVLAAERGWSITVAFFVVMVTVPWWSSGSVPMLTEGMLVLLMCYAWNLVGGFLGEFSMAHMIFWGIGSYTTVLTINHDRALLPWVIGAVVLAVACGIVMSGLIKLSGLTDVLTLAILTTVFAEVAISVARGSDALGGAEGLIAISLPSWSTQTMFVLVVVLAAVAGLTNVAVANSRLGREWLAIRDDRVAAEVAGINVQWRRALAYVISAAFFAAGGIYQAYYAGYATPDVSLGLAILFIAILAVFTGGHGTVLGPLVGWLIIYGLQVLASQMSDSPKVSLYAQLTEFAVALLILRILLPRLRGDSVSGALLRLPRLLRDRTRRAAEPLAAHASVSRTSAERVLGLTDVNAARPRLTEGLKVTGMRKSFGRLEVLRDVTFEIRPGEVVGILGPNGAGKTTLCNLISGLEPATSGLITLDGSDVTHLRARKRSAAGFGRSFQTPRLFPSLTLMQNLMLGSRQIEESAADQALASMAIPNSSARRGDDSQFFARRLTEVLKASLQADSLLILDEPLAGLTSDEHDIVLGMARQKAQDGACVLIVEHLIPVLAPAVDRIVVLHEGRIIADGRPADVLKDEAVVEAYLGSAHEMEETSHE